MLSPAAGWLKSIVAFAQAPEGLEHRATLEVRTTTLSLSVKTMLFYVPKTCGHRLYASAPCRYGDGGCDPDACASARAKEALVQLNI